LENFGILNYSKCQFLGKFDQGSALSWVFENQKISKYQILGKFGQGSALSWFFRVSCE
jgi:hypothetical protein